MSGNRQNERRGLVELVGRLRADLLPAVREQLSSGRRRAGERLKTEISVLSKLFSPRLDKFLAVNFDPAMVEIVYVESFSGGLRLLAYETAAVVGSQEKAREMALVEFLRDFLEKNAVTTHDVLISISDPDSIFFKDIVLPVMPDAEILEAARWQLRDDVPFDLDQGSIDWQVLEEVTGEDGQKGRRIMFIAANNAVIYQYLSVVQQCRLDPLSVTNSAFNYAHILENLPDVPEIVAVLDFGRAETTFGIYMQKKLGFVRRLPVSWERLLQSLTKTLVSDGGATQLTPEQAEEITRSVSIPQENTAVLPGNIKTTHFLSLMRPFLETLTREVKFSLDYFAMNFGKEKPSVLYIAGESSRFRNMDQYLHAAFEMDVVCLPLPARVDTRALGAASPGPEDQNRIMNVLGAALGGPTRISLLPVEIKTRRLEFLERIFLRSLAIISGVVFIFSLSVMQFQARNYEQRLKNARVHMQTMVDIKSLVQDVRTRENLAREIEGRGVPLDGLLSVVAAAVPEEILLDNLDFNAAAYRLTLKGSVTASREAGETILADFMQKLEASSFFTEARFVSSQKTGTAYAFEIECTLFH
ncbi:MAG: pilus assembly protein PilM [Candidatus Omnitrophica bacterium]|nr:pilus assembly protein PilM [Candidatus Omnitrophota bacterium]